MSGKKAQQSRKQQQKVQQKKKSNLPLMITALAVVCAAVIAAAVTRGEKTGNADTASQEVAADNASSSAKEAVQVIGAGESLVIPVSEVTGTAQFYPVEVDGTAMEIIAVKASDGTIRTAFNTCQVCYSSGRGYYVQNGDYLVCQNCRNRFTADQVEISAGGCNPYPIFEQNKTVTEEAIEISYDFLQEAEKIFANWKK